MGIKIINSFDLNSPLPLDARAVANNINEMNELITKNFVVAGQMCYNKADNKLYVLKKNSEGALLSWHEVADSVDLDNINKVLPTDIAVKDNKLGLERNNVWLTNQNAINLGDNITYDATTKTLNAKGGGGGSSYTPLEIKAEGDISHGVMITKEQYDTLVGAILNNEPVIAYITTYNGSILESKLPLLLPTMATDSNNAISYWGAYHIGSAQEETFNTGIWGLVSITSEGNTMYGIFFSRSLYYLEYGAGLQFDTVNNKLQFSRSTRETGLSGSAVSVDTINGNPVIHSEFTTSRNYTIPTITFED